MRQFFAKLFGFGTRTTAPATPEQNVGSEEPTFLFPETRAAWRVALESLREERAAQEARHEAALSRFAAEMAALKASAPASADVRSELERRRVQRELDKLQSAVRVEHERRRKEEGERQTEAKLTEEFRQAERERIVREGETLLQSVMDKEEGESCHGGYRPPRYFKEERHLVRLEDGRHFVCLLVHEGLARDTGQKARKGIYKGSPSLETRTVSILEPTGEYAPPVVNWVTDSVAQFTDEELRMVAGNG